ncbi:MAG: hypothetical protein NWE82_00485 [Candidatus Bathyarchaeota archaeon]|jgi:hypothetical protein|nr:hypothetical protein [Candidatus Bathyarchaeota archaeon]
MKISLSMFVNVILASILVTSLAFMTATTSSAQYDPWADYDENGLIDIFDIVKVAIPYGASGDPTKNVTVTNWPVTTGETVWYAEELTDGELEVSSMYYAEGFGKLHLLMRVGGLTVGEEMELRVVAPLWNPAHTAYYPTEVYSRTFTSTNYFYDIALSTPMDEFYFIVDAAAGTTCTASLRIWLSWSD